MSGKAIHVVFTPDGETVVEAVGFQGPTCARFVDPIAQALGGEDRKVHLKPELHLASGQRRAWQVKLGDREKEGGYGW